MEVNVTIQALSLAGSVGLGLGLGLLYDFFRVLRVRLPLPLLGGLLDALFWGVATATLFVWSVLSGGGVVRIYIALGLLTGCWLYFRLLSRWVLALAYRLADVCAQIAHIFLVPVRQLLNFLKKIEKFFKNHFHYRRNWYKIETIFAEDASLRHRPKPAYRGGKKSENHKS